MTPEILTTLIILVAAAVLLFSEKLRVDLVALLVLGALALTGLVTPEEALSGFSNPAVITVWAVFVLSGGLSRTGVASLVGKWMLQLAGKGEVRMLVTIMLAAGILSAFMNNVGVAAMLLPVVMHIAQRTDRPPSKLLMPLAFGSLLGGMITLIGTPPNLLASEALRKYGLEPFGLFDFAPIGLALMVAGTAFMALIGRRLLPDRNVREGLVGDDAMREAFDLEERLVTLRLPHGSELAGKTLLEVRIGSATGLNVISILRRGHFLHSPDAGEILQEGDRLLVAGRLDRLSELRERRLPVIMEGEGTQILPGLECIASHGFEVIEVRLAQGSEFTGKTLHQIGFRHRYGANVLTILRENGGSTPSNAIDNHMQDTPLSAREILILQVDEQAREAIQNDSGWMIEETRPEDLQKLHDRIFAISAPKGSALVNKSLAESHLGDAYGLNVIALLRNQVDCFIPTPEDILQPGDILLVEGDREDLDLLRGLGKLTIEWQEALELKDLESEQVGLVEVVLSPQTRLDGRSLRDIDFREKYGLNILAIWRQGKAYRSNLRDMALRFGDALLIHGRRDRLTVLARETDFLVLSDVVGEMPRQKKAPLSTLIMFGVVLSVLVGWLPIAIAAVAGAGLMVLTGCLTMDEAYRYIEWKAVFLIAGMLPLGIAMQNSGAAELLAGGMVNAVGGYGSAALITGLFALTAVASQFMPNPVVTVLMAPIAINTAMGLGLSPHSLMMVIAISASSSFLSPVGHPANVLIMGPGGYRFKDYFKVGLPLTILVLIVTLVLLPIVWPF